MHPRLPSFWRPASPLAPLSLLGLLLALGFPSASEAWPNTDTAPSQRVSFTSSAVTATGELIVGGYIDYDKPIVARFRSDGDLDPEFGQDGYVVLDPGTEGIYPTGLTVAIAPNGDIVVYEPARRLQRLSSIGQIDRSFGVDGISAPNASLQAAASVDNLAVDSAGRPIIAGSSDRTLAIERFTADGRPDPTFDGDGLAVASPVPASSVQERGSLQQGELVTVRPDDRPLVVGEALLDSGDAEVVAAQFHTDGTLDASFNGDAVSRIPVAAPAGSVQNPSYYAARAIALDAVGSAVVRLEPRQSFPSPYSECGHGGSALRFDANGVLDTGFGDQGFAAADLGACPRDFALLDTGGVFAVGVAQHRFPPWQATQTLYTSTGQLDPAFGPQPRQSMVAGFDTTVASVARMSDGNLITVGNAQIPDCYVPQIGNCYLGFLLAQRSNGTVVDDFGSHGVATLPDTRICPDPFALCPYPYRRDFKRLAHRGVARNTDLGDRALRTRLKCRYEVQEPCEVRVRFSAPGTKGPLAKIRRTSIADGELERLRSERLSRRARAKLAGLSRLDAHAVFSAEHQRPVQLTKRIKVRGR